MIITTIITAIAGKLVGSVGQKAAKPLAAVILVTVIAGLVAAAWAGIKSDIIQNFVNSERADRAEEKLERTSEAYAEDDKREIKDRSDDDKLEKVIDDAVDKNPQERTDSAGDSFNAAADELRKQRAAPTPDR